jgi:hypothetical protein
MEKFVFADIAEAFLEREAVPEVGANEETTTNNDGKDSVSWRFFFQTKMSDVGRKCLVSDEMSRKRYYGGILSDGNGIAEGIGTSDETTSDGKEVCRSNLDSDQPHSFSHKIYFRPSTTETSSTTSASR